MIHQSTGTNLTYFGDRFLDDGDLQKHLQMIVSNPKDYQPFYMVIGGNSLHTMLRYQLGQGRFTEALKYKENLRKLLPVRNITNYQYLICRLFVRDSCRQSVFKIAVIYSHSFIE